MSTTQSALENVKNRRLGYWKLYKGTTKVSQCDRDENPSGDPDIAFQQFEDEIQTRLLEPGSYTVNIYRAPNGDKGGYRYNFTISSNDQPRMSNGYNRSGMDYNDLRASIERELRMFAMLENIEKKITAIGEYIASQATEDKADDNEALKLLIGAFATMRNKAAAAAPAVGKSFASL